MYELVSPLNCTWVFYNGKILENSVEHFLQCNTLTVPSDIQHTQCPWRFFAHSLERIQLCSRTLPVGNTRNTSQIGAVLADSLVQERAEDRPPYPQKGRRVAVVYRTDPHRRRSLDCFHHHLVALRVDLLLDETSDTGRTQPRCYNNVIKRFGFAYVPSFFFSRRSFPRQRRGCQKIKLTNTFSEHDPPDDRA